MEIKGGGKIKKEIGKWEITVEHDNFGKSWFVCISPQVGWVATRKFYRKKEAIKFFRALKKEEEIQKLYEQLKTKRDKDLQELFGENFLKIVRKFEQL